MSIKIERIADNIQKELSYILALEVRDDDIKFVTITDVHVTNDLSYAKVYFTVLDDKKKDSTLKALKDASSFIRKELAKRVNIRHIPELRFICDESIEYGKNIEGIIDSLHGDD
jgi:ribosome-binding factor A